MAAHPAARQLTEAHRLAQVRLGAHTVAQMVALWGLVDVTHLDDTIANWLRVALPVIRSQRATSARLAGVYVRTFRTIETGDGKITPALADTLDARQALTSLTVTGPARVKAATARGVPIERASALGRDATARAGMRLALEGGRSTIVDTVRTDPAGHGWARATSGEPCAFCAGLAARGPASSEAAVDFEAHDGCSCTAEPVYDTAGDWPAGSRQHQQQWQQATRGLSGADALNAFRRSLAAP